MPPRLILIPGLAVDSRLFNAQRLAIPEVITPPWLDPEPKKAGRHESLAHYAERMAASVKPRINGPVVVGGVSFGGMLALEMARHLNATHAVLIGSCRDPRAVLPLLPPCEYVCRAVPDPLIALGKRLGFLGVGRGGPIPPADRALLCQMLIDMPVPLLRWGARAIMDWQGCHVPAAGTDGRAVSVRHIHGANDWIIPLGRLTHKPTTIVPRGAHVLNMSHPREVNAFLIETLAMA